MSEPVPRCSTSNLKAAGYLCWSMRCCLRSAGVLNCLLQPSTRHLYTCVRFSCIQHIVRRSILHAAHRFLHLHAAAGLSRKEGVVDLLQVQVEVVRGQQPQAADAALKHLALFVLPACMPCQHRPIAQAACTSHRCRAMLPSPRLPQQRISIRQGWSGAGFGQSLLGQHLPPHIALCKQLMVHGQAPQLLDMLCGAHLLS